MFLNFNEVNLLMQNLKTGHKENFLMTLSKLEKNTKDAILLHSIHTLRQKLQDCTPAQIEALYEDLSKHNVITTEHYILK